ncbi:MAG: aldo/keto reductase [Solirubrobacterales bacterium]
MQYRKLGGTGLNVSMIGFGGIPIQRVDEAEAGRIVNTALDAGINFFDSARAYTDSETKLGAALEKQRGRAILATKSMARDAGAMEQEIRRSLEALRTDTIDLYQLHNVKDLETLDRVLAPDGALTALQEAKNRGDIRHIGITGHIRSVLVEALKTRVFETVQFPFNPVETAGAQEMFDVAAACDAGVIIMKPLAGGALQQPELALRYILAHPVSTVIPGMDSVEQVAANARCAAAAGSLSEAEMEVLRREADCLGTSFCRRCEYCMPCPQGIDPPTIFLLDGYYQRYKLQEWAKVRYNGLAVPGDECLECGVCEERCPYGLPIARMVREAAERLK